MINPNKKRLRRTMMFLNAQKPGLIKDPYIYKPDSIMLDLEDAVAENQKDAARFSLFHALRTINYRGCERVVRINGLDSPYWKEDIRCAVAGGCDSIRIPKTESAKDVYIVEKEVIQAEKDFGRPEGSVLIMAAIESARGVMRALDMLRTVHKSSREIKNLKELNSLLENVQRSEDAIAHQERLQIMGTMTGGIAHEFNNFLTPIMGHAELLMMELPEGSDEQDSAKEILEASEKAMDVVKQISSLSRKNVETVYKCIPVKKMMQRALKMIASVCPPQVHLESELQVEQENILGNTTQLNQVLLNICVNAIHAIGKKEGTIHVKCEVISRETLAGFLDKELPDTWKDYIYISIKDNGCGMEKETLRQIFDPFFTTKKGGEGTGLGLALVEQIVTSHKGYVFAESQPGVGSCFHIGLPVLQADQPEETVHVGERHEIRMVFADDNAKVLELLRRSFDKIGMQIQTCMTVEELSANLAEKEADVLVVEESIEEQSGVDFCMSIAGKYPKMLKLVSIESISREIVEAKKKGIINGYVEKPLSDRNVLEAVRECQKEQGLY